MPFPPQTPIRHRSQCENNVFGETLRRQLESIVKVDILEDGQRIADRQSVETPCFELVIQDGQHEKLASDQVGTVKSIIISFFLKTFSEFNSGLILLNFLFTNLFSVSVTNLKFLFLLEDLMSC